MKLSRNIALGILALWFALLLGSMLQALLAAPPSSDRIGQIGYFRDSSATLGIADVAKRRFTPTGPDFLGGYDRAAQWFRLTVAPPATKGKDADDTVLQLSLNQLDHVTLYLPASRGWTALENGDTVPIAKRGAKLLPLGFHLPDSALGRTLFLRVQSTSSLGFQIWATSLAEAQGNLSRRRSAGSAPRY